MAHGKGIKINVKVLNTCLIIGLIAVLVIAMAVVQMNKPKAAEPKAPVKKASLLVTVITPPKCDDCFDTANFAAAIRQLPNVNVTESVLEYNSTEGKALIAEYSLSRLPAAVVTGETENISLPTFTKKGRALYFDSTPPPYYNVSQKRVVGRISITYITSTACPQCFNITQFSDQLKEAGVAIGAQRMIDAAGKDAQAIISRYGITKIPAMLMSSDALEYPLVAQVWPAIGTQESDGMLLMRNATPPYYDFSDSKMHGLVTITYITDKSCKECYDAKMHREVLEQSFGMKFKEEKTADVSERAGKDLVKKYGLKYVPTLLLDKEASAYGSLEGAWEQIGDVADDGTFVFKNVNLLQGITYKDIETNQTNTTAAQ